jgi:TonB family protein
MEDPDIHLQRLLAPQDLDYPWYKTVIQGIKDVIHPPKLPPLEVTSKPVDPRELKGLSGLYAGNETKAGLSSILIHGSVIALLFFLGSLKPVQKLVKDTTELIIPADLRPYKPKDQVQHGGGGGGARQPLDASKGKLPKPAPRQFTPPRVDPIPNVKLPMTPTIIADELPVIQANNYGNITGLNIPSNGSGIGGGIGSGVGGGIGPGRGAGVGPGSGGGFGGGAYRIGGGVTAPTVLLQVEPEYSEEARKAKYQGTVVLSLVVDEAGKAQNIKVVRSLGLGLDQKAIEAVEKWKFKPGMKDGKAVPVIASIEVNFRLL